MRLAIVTSHPIQYYAPLFREIGQHLDLHVFFAHRSSPEEQARAGFGVEFQWDVDLLSGFAHTFLTNVSRHPGTDHFFGCDTPEIGTWIGEGRFDVVLVLGWNLKSYIQTLMASKRLRRPVLVRGDSQLHSPRSRLKEAAKSIVYPPFLRCFDGALYVGQRSRAYFEYYKYPPERLFFAPHCVDTQWFSIRATKEARQILRAKYSVDPATKIVLFAGKLVPFKRPLDLVSAVGICRGRGFNVEMMVAGDGPLRAEILSAAKAAGVPLHFLGFCNQTEMPSVYAASDYVVLPSSGEETWGLVANEALACNRPVILSHLCGSAPDLACIGGGGRIFLTGDVVDLANAIQQMIETPCPQEAVVAMSDKFSLKTAVEGIQNAARTVCAEVF